MNVSIAPRGCPVHCPRWRSRPLPITGADGRAARASGNRSRKTCDWSGQMRYQPGSHGYQYRTCQPRTRCLRWWRRQLVRADAEAQGCQRVTGGSAIDDSTGALQPVRMGDAAGEFHRPRPDSHHRLDRPCLADARTLLRASLGAVQCRVPPPGTACPAKRAGRGDHRNQPTEPSALDNSSITRNDVKGGSSSPPSSAADGFGTVPRQQSPG